MNDKRLNERLRRLEMFMSTLNEEKIRKDERLRIALEAEKRRMDRWRKVWEFFKVVLSPVLAAIVTATLMNVFKL